MSYNSKIMLVSDLYVFPRIMPAKLVIYNNYSQNHASTLGSGLTITTYIAEVMIIISSICLARVCHCIILHIQFAVMRFQFLKNQIAFLLVNLVTYVMYLASYV